VSIDTNAYTYEGVLDHVDNLALQRIAVSDHELAERSASRRALEGIHPQGSDTHQARPLILRSTSCFMRKDCRRHSVKPWRSDHLECEERSNRLGKRLTDGVRSADDALRFFLTGPHRHIVACFWSLILALM
jgi:hypothetical protein